MCEECTGEGRRQRGGGPQEDTQLGTSGLSGVHPSAPCLCPAAPQAQPQQLLQHVAGNLQPVVPPSPTLSARVKATNASGNSPHFLPTCWGLQLSLMVVLLDVILTTQAWVLPITLIQAQKGGKCSCMFTNRGVHKFPPYFMCVLVASKMRQAQ